jgi:hypothetical protein
MRTVRIDDVVVPVGFEKTAVGVEVALVGGDAVGAIENGKEIRQQVDQHSTGSDLREGGTTIVTQTKSSGAGILDAE